MSKRSLHEANDDSDDDFGPELPSDVQGDNEVLVSSQSEETKSTDVKKKHKASIPSNLQKFYLENLPSSTFYEYSFMHRDIVTHIVISKSTEFVITASIDGHVKFWKKMKDNIDFVKHYQAHLGKINSVVLSPDGGRLMTTAEDKMIKFFEVSGFDMSHMISVDYVPTACCWLGSAGAAAGGRGAGAHGLYVRVAVADSQSGVVRVYRTDGAVSDVRVETLDEDEDQIELMQAMTGSSTVASSDQAIAKNTSQLVLSELKIHSSPVLSMVLNVNCNIVISIDSKGMIEYWNAETLSFPRPDEGISFRHKTETDLYDLLKGKTRPCSQGLTISPRGEVFAVCCYDKVIRVFDFYNGKLKRKYDESVKVYKDSSGVSVGGLDSLEIGRREAIERELESPASAESLAHWNAIFDESGNYLIYGSLIGIKVVSLVDNQVVKVIGLGESGGERFLSLSLYQGVPVVDTQYVLSKGGSDAMTRTADQLHHEPEPDPTLFCTSFKRRRFYTFSRREPDENARQRDVFNELPSEDDQSAAVSTPKLDLGKEAVLHTKYGDIVIKLFYNECPKTVENFTALAKKGYYDHVIFHRVIKGFMVQTGDPLGDGTGGESVWGGEFEDEFVKTLKHDRPFTVSMANHGPNTNGSQFFITTVPTPWLDNKHTIFGRVTQGFEVVSTIENLKVGKRDLPFDKPQITSIDIVY